MAIGFNGLNQSAIPRSQALTRSLAFSKYFSGAASVAGLSASKPDDKERDNIDHICFSKYSELRIFGFSNMSETAMSVPIKVLFVCVANSARSQLAEALLRHTDPRFAAFSAGSQPSSVDPRTVAALENIEVDASGLRSKSIDEFSDEKFDYVITLCDKSARECQAMPGAGEVIAWDFPDPVTSADPAAFRHTLHDIHERIKLFVLVKTKHLEDL